MGYMDLLDYIKASQEGALKDGSFVRFRLDADKTGGLVLTRNKKFEEFDMGTISLSPVFTEGKGRHYFADMPNGIVKLDDIKALLKGSKVLLSTGEPLEDMEPNRVNLPSNLDLGGSTIEYIADNVDDEHYGGDPTKIFVPLLRTDPALRNNGYAKFLLEQVAKYSKTNGYLGMYGVGNAVEPNFEYANKTSDDERFIKYYKAKYQNKPYSVEASANLALLYKKLGFRVSPLGPYFIFSKPTESTKVTKLDCTYLHNDSTTLDGDDIIFGK